MRVRYASWSLHVVLGWNAVSVIAEPVVSPEVSDAVSNVFRSRLGNCRRTRVSRQATRTKGRVVETFLLWLLVICVGVASVLTFVADAFFADRMAASLRGLELTCEA